MTLTSAHFLSKGSLDAVSLSMVYAILLFAIPAPMVLGPLGGAGTPAQMWAMGLFILWCFGVTAGYISPGPFLRIKRSLALFAVTVLVSYVAAAARPLLPVEMRAADRALLSLVAWAGISLVVADGIQGMARIDPLLRAIAAAGAVLALIGILQFYGINIVQYIRVPGLVVNGDVGELGGRSLFFRAQGTASHSIEFGAVASMTLPLSLHFAFYSPGGRTSRRWLFMAILTAIGMAMAISRSAIIGGAIVFATLLPVWPRGRRRQAYLALAIGSVCMKVVVPGLIGTIRAMFIGVGNDPSTTGRTSDYPAVWRLFVEAPVFGRGAGTFIPSIYRTFDNQYLLTLVSVGLFGVIGLIVLMLGGLRTARLIRVQCLDEDTRHLAQSLLASISVAGLVCATFDMFSFPMCTGLFFLLLGCLGALERFTHTSSGSVPQARLRWASRWSRPWMGRVSSTTILALIATAIAFFLCLPKATSSQRYEAGGTILFGTSDDMRAPYAAAFPTWTVSKLVEWHLRQSGISTVVAEGSGETELHVAVGDGSLAVETDHDGYGATLHYLVRAKESRVAASYAKAVRADVNSYLEELQLESGAPRQTWIVVKDAVPTSGAVPVAGSASRAVGGLILLTIPQFYVFRFFLVRIRLARSIFRSPPSRNRVNHERQLPIS